MCQSPILRNLEPFPQTATRPPQRSAFINPACCRFLCSPGDGQTRIGTAILSALPSGRLDSCAGSARSTEPFPTMPTHEDRSPIRRPLSYQRTTEPACAWNLKLPGFPPPFPRNSLHQPRHFRANRFTTRPWGSSIPHCRLNLNGLKLQY